MIISIISGTWPQPYTYDNSRMSRATTVLFQDPCPLAAWRAEPRPTDDHFHWQLGFVFMLCMSRFCVRSQKTSMLLQRQSVMHRGGKRAVPSASAEKFCETPWHQTRSCVPHVDYLGSSERREFRACPLAGMLNMRQDQSNAHGQQCLVASAGERRTRSNCRMCVTKQRP